MAWRKYFKLAPGNKAGIYSPLSKRGGRTSDSGEDAVGMDSYKTQIPESYRGCPNRLEKYSSWESMDSDSEINSALDILAEFSTQASDEDGLCFTVNYKEPPTETEAKIIKKQLQTWYNLNEFHKRAFKIFRNVLKYGDQVFLRDPETFRLFYVECDQLLKVIVNESEGKLPEQYVIRNLNPNFQNLTVTQVTTNNIYNIVPSGPGYNASGAGYNMPNNPSSSASRFVHGANEACIDAQHILHLSLTEGLDANWPFGVSVLENVFKVFKQKELLEDSILIYRIQRAPERRVFKIDVGDMPSHMAMQFIEKVKNEIHQRRIPGRGEGGGNFMDSTYVGLPPNADFFFPQTSCLTLDTGIKLLDGRDLSLQDIIDEYNNGKTNWIYSINPETQLVEPGEIEWAGVTRKNAQLIRVTLDDGSFVDVTPDHKFILRDGSEIEAQYLKSDDSLMSLDLDYTVLSIEWLSETKDTGDIHVKSKNDCHNFVLSIGIFVHNSGRGSSVEILPGGCLDMITQVPLLDGRTLTLNELTEEFNSGKENWVYSCNPENGHIVPGIISWAGVTQQSAKVIKITLDNEKTITCTLDHKFPILGRGFVEANNLVVNDKLIPFENANGIIINIEYLDEPIQVGTLTIDQDEKYHNYHTFALASGVFTKNSNLGEVNDLLYFNNKLARGLRIPSSYLPTGPDDSQSPVNDGRVGTALIQEFRFNQYCQRLQKLICDPLDTEFKAYLKFCGINIDSSIFKLEFNPPQNFAHYRQAELDASKISTFSQLEGYQYFSKRWLMERYLGLKPDEILENQKLWKEEHVKPDQYAAEPSDMRNIGITPGGIDNEMQDFDMGGEGEMGEEPTEGGEEMAPGSGGAPAGSNTPVMGAGETPAGGNQ